MDGGLVAVGFDYENRFWLSLCGAATLGDQRMAGALRVPESERRVFAVCTCPVASPGGAFSPETGMTFAGCDVGCVLQIAGVVTPCVQRVQDAVSVVAISAAGQQTVGPSTGASWSITRRHATQLSSLTGLAAPGERGLVQVLVVVEVVGHGILPGVRGLCLTEPVG